MSTIKQFEELIVWQKARLLTKEIYKTFKNLKFRDAGLCDQIQRASVSIMSNIAEGFERGTKQEFLNYLYIAKGSAGEVRVSNSVRSSDWIQTEYNNQFRPSTFASFGGQQSR